MAKSKKAKTEPDAIYFLKLLLYFIVGSIWVRTADPLIAGVSGFPVGLVVGLLFATHDHFQIDRKIEYLVLFLAAVLSYIAPIGIVLQL